MDLWGRDMTGGKEGINAARTEYDPNRYRRRGEGRELQSSARERSPAKLRCAHQSGRQLSRAQLRLLPISIWCSLQVHRTIAGCLFTQMMTWIFSITLYWCDPRFGSFWFLVSARMVFTCFVLVSLLTWRIPATRTSSTAYQTEILPTSSTLTTTKIWQVYFIYLHHRVCQLIRWHPWWFQIFQDRRGKRNSNVHDSLYKIGLCSTVWKIFQKHFDSFPHKFVL